MHGAADGAVRRVPSLAPKLLRVHIAQNALVKEVRNIDHIRGDAGIGGIQPGMTAAGIGQAHGQPHGTEVGLYRFYLIGLEVHIDGVAHGAGELIHQPTGLSEKLVFRLLCGPGNDNGLKLTVVEEAVEYLPDQYSKSGGRAEARACGQSAFDLRVKAANIQAQFSKLRHKASHQRFRRTELGGADIPVIYS